MTCRTHVILQVHVIVTTTGGIEEDLIKCLAPTYKGDFSLPGAYLRSKGLNRIGNLLVPNDNYCKFQDWIIPIFNQMLKEQTHEVFYFILFCTFPALQNLCSSVFVKVI
jgi:deoxyhypusine synthase